MFIFRHRREDFVPENAFFSFSIGAGPIESARSTNKDVSPLFFSFLFFSDFSHSFSSIIILDMPEFIFCNPETGSIKSVGELNILTAAAAIISNFSRLFCKHAPARAPNPRLSSLAFPSDYAYFVSKRGGIK